MEIKEIIEKANNKISTLTCYGIRKITPTSDGVIASWSNGSASWFTMGTVKKEGEEVTLDANQFIAYTDRETFHKIKCNLNQLPLYSNSFEARFGSI